MEARIGRLVFGLVVLVCAEMASTSHAQFGAQRFAARSDNFIVFADSDQMARTVSVAAEKQRRDLAEYWLGRELPPWPAPCPIHVSYGAQLGAGGETRFTLMSGHVGNWMMNIQGSPERILDSVLPHELTHTILATHFAPLNKHVPRWADEGACTTVEHPSEKNKHVENLERYLRTGKGLPFNRMFAMKEYPRDILTLYAQGHSVVQFLIDQGGPQKFVAFLEDGLRSDDWEGAVKRSYLYASLGYLKQEWNQWLADGRPDVANYSPIMRLAANKSLRDIQGDPPVSALTSAAVTANVAATTIKAPLQLASNATVPRGNDSWYRRQLLKSAGAPNVPGQSPANDSPQHVGPSVPIAELDQNQSLHANGMIQTMVPLPTRSSAAASPGAVWR